MIRAAGLALIGAAALLAGSAVMAEPAREAWPKADARPPEVAGNPASEARIALGRRLFYDADLSRDGTMSCGTCHEQKRAFTEGNRTHPGVTGEPGRRNVMALANVGWFSSLTWADPSTTTLEDQVRTPVLGDHPVEMGMKGMETALAERLAYDRCYPAMFAAAFPEAKGEMSMRTVSLAIAAFERRLVSFDAPYDRMRRGEAADMSAAAKRGETAFNRSGCASCHAGPLFTDAAGADARAAFHRIGEGQASDLGLEEISGDAADRWKFRTPSLRNVALTAPYLHDGSAATLTEAIRAHREAGGASADEAAIDDIAAFLGALTDETFVHDEALSLPKVRCAAAGPALHNNP